MPRRRGQRCRRLERRSEFRPDPIGNRAPTLDEGPDACDCTSDAGPDPQSSPHCHCCIFWPRWPARCAKSLSSTGCCCRPPPPISVPLRRVSSLTAAGGMMTTETGGRPRRKTLRDKKRRTNTSDSVRCVPTLYPLCVQPIFFT